MAAVADIIDGRVSKGVDGLSATRVFKVDGVTGTASGRMLSVLGATGVPAYGDAHPADSSIVVVSLDVAPEAGDSEIFYVEATYGPAPTSDPRNSPPGTVLARRLRSSGDTTVTLRDKDGVVMQLNYTGVSGSGFTLTQQGLEVEVPGRGYAFEVEQVIAEGGVKTTIDTYRGAVNALAWNGNPRTWMCGDPSADPIDGTSNYLVTWSFLYKHETWDHVERVRLGGLVPHDAVSAGGEATFRVLREVDFSPLAFVVP